MEFHGCPWVSMDSHGIPEKIHGNPPISIGTALNPAIGDVSDTRWWCSERFCAHWGAICARITPYMPPQVPLDPPRNQLLGPQYPKYYFWDPHVTVTIKPPPTK